MGYFSGEVLIKAFAVASTTASHNRLSQVKIFNTLKTQDENHLAERSIRLVWIDLFVYITFLTRTNKNFEKIKLFPEIFPVCLCEMCFR